MDLKLKTVILSIVLMMNCSNTNENPESHFLTDFTTSQFLWETSSGSTGRFSLESTAEIVKNGNSTGIFVLSGVMACDVYGKDPLFLQPPYLFEAVFSDKEVKIFRTYQNKTDHTAHKINELFRSVKPLVKKESFYRLKSFKEIEETVYAGQLLVGQVRYVNDIREIITLTFPIKHINVSNSKNEFQVETGKVLYFQHSLQASQPAYLAFNNFETINFLIENEASKEIKSHKAQVYIYKKK